ILFHFVVTSEEGLEHMEGCFSLHRCDRSRERNAFRACLDTVLCHAALGHAANTHKSIETFVLVHAASRMQVEQPYLANGRCTHEIRTVIDIRTHFQTYTTRHALGKFICRLTFLLRHPLPRTKIICAVDRHPCF